MAHEKGVAIMVLQETWRQDGQWRFWLKGFNSIESLASHDCTRRGQARREGEEPGRHGLAILVREDISAYEVGQESGYFLFVRVSGGPVQQPCIVGTIYPYPPHIKEVYRQVGSGTKNQTASVYHQSPDDPILQYCWAAGS